ncbi:MAG: hypothetical protein J5849_05300 [Clostridia bacterium]|nr:hypothetical protein [Clostridia bacterium]
MKKALLVIMAVIDAVLLAVIILSAATGWRIAKPVVPEETQLHAGGETHGGAKLDGPETAVPPGSTKATVGPAEEPAETKRPVTEPETEPKTEPETETRIEPETEPDTQAAPEYPPYFDVSTHGDLTPEDLAGFRWSPDAGPYWEDLTPDAVRIADFDAVRGGWMAYVLDDPAMDVSTESVERVLNVEISGSADSADATFDWRDIYIESEEQVLVDSSPDSVFSGTWSDGRLEAFGPGMITLRDFFYSGGREYAVGTMTWPDGVPAIIALVRP